MSLDEAPLSTHATDQAWFSMLLVNDPNTALVGSLRPSRQYPLWAALRRPFESRAPLAIDAGEQIPGLRPGRGRLVAGLLLMLGVGLAGVGLERVWTTPAEAPTTSAALQSERLASARLPSRPAPARQLPVAVRSTTPASAARMPPEPALSRAAAVAPPAPEPRAQPRERAAKVPRATATGLGSTSAARKKAEAAPLRRDLRRALKGSRPPR